MFHFRRIHHDIRFLLVGLSAVSGLGAYTNFIRPDTAYSIAGSFVLLFLACFCILRYILDNPRRSFLYASVICILGILRIIGLREWYFPFLLLVTAGAMDAYGAHTDKPRQV